jgi:hypothetical protein
LGKNLAPHQAQTAGSNTRKYRKQNGKGSAGGDAASKAKQLLVCIASITRPSTLFQPEAHAIEYFQWRSWRVNVNNCGAVFTGRSNKEKQPDGKQQCEQQGRGKG